MIPTVNRMIASAIQHNPLSMQARHARLERAYKLAEEFELRLRIEEEAAVKQAAQTRGIQSPATTQANLDRQRKIAEAAIKTNEKAQKVHNHRVKMERVMARRQRHMEWLVGKVNQARQFAAETWNLTKQLWMYETTENKTRAVIKASGVKSETASKLVYGIQIARGYISLTLMTLVLGVEGVLAGTATLAINLVRWSLTAVFSATLFVLEITRQTFIVVARTLIDTGYFLVSKGIDLLAWTAQSLGRIVIAPFSWFSNRKPEAGPQPMPAAA